MYVLFQAVSGRRRAGCNGAKVSIYRVGWCAGREENANFALVKWKIEK